MGAVVTRGIVLRHVNYRESSRILTLFSRDLGRITVSAKGCMRPKCRERAATEMFTLGEYTLAERAGRYYLNAASIENAYYNLRLDLDRLSVATYFTELCECVLNEEEPQAELFDLLAHMLSVLCDEKIGPELARLFFEVRAMDILGFRPEVSACAACGGELPDKALFSVSAGGAVCGGCRMEAADARPVMPGTLAFLRHVQDWDADRISVLKPAQAVMDEIEKVWRPFVKWHLEKTCRADWFMEKLKGNLSGPGFTQPF